MTQSRSSTNVQRQADVVNDPLQTVDGLIVDPFASDKLSADPAALAERVAFRLWSEGHVGGRAIEQARKDAGAVGRLDQVLVRQGACRSGNCRDGAGR